MPQAAFCVHPEEITAPQPPSHCSAKVEGEVRPNPDGFIQSGAISSTSEEEVDITDLWGDKHEYGLTRVKKGRGATKKSAIRVGIGEVRDYLALVI